MKENSENLGKLWGSLDNVVLSVISNQSLSVDEDLADVYRYMMERGISVRIPEFQKIEKAPFNYVGERTKVIAYSGGKVSLSCALRYKDSGHNIVLYHIEQDKATTEKVYHVADMLQVPVHVHKLPKEWMSALHSPADTALIIRLVLQYAIKNGYSEKIVLGCFDSASIYNNERKDIGKCSEIVNCYRQLVQRYLPFADFLNPMPMYSIVWDELLGHKQYMRYIATDNALDAVILKNMCMDFNLDECVSSIYMQNISFLKKEYIRRKQKDPGNIIDVWNEFFHYRIEQSKLYSKLMESR